MEQKNKEQEALPVHLFKGERVVIVEKEEAVEAGVHIIDDYGDSALISEADAIRLHIEGKLTTERTEFLFSFTDYFLQKYHISVHKMDFCYSFQIRIKNN